MTEFLVKYGEISLKGANRAAFERRLIRNIVSRLPRAAARARRTWGRIFVTVEDQFAAAAEQILAATFGVVSFARVLRFPKTEAGVSGGRRRARRRARRRPGATQLQGGGTSRDKSFALTSYDIAYLLGDLLRERMPEVTVDVHRPEVTVNVEVRDWIYAYAEQRRGLGGLPVGCSGRGLLLLSGGIDSPVAGYLMGGRGLAVDAVYFHSYPFTSKEAEEKVHTLARTVSRFLPRLTLYVVAFTPLQVRIKEAAPAAEVTLLMRCAMMQIAGVIAGDQGHGCLITGESLGQVASQTVPSLHLTGSYATLPVLRPLIGQSKEAIIALACEIGTFAISTLPYPDCCTLFAPRHPVINPDVAELRASYDRLAMGSLVADAADAAQSTRFEGA